MFFIYYQYVFIVAIYCDKHDRITCYMYLIAVLFH